MNIGSNSCDKLCEIIIPNKCKHIIENLVIYLNMIGYPEFST